jgi:H/ACA ribonucleoprotein complex subunit 4
MKFQDQLLIKSEAPINEEHGCRPEDRDIEAYINYGIINLDKPKGPTSHEVVTWVRKILNVQKTGHGGTLDPRVTGILPCAIGKSTKAVSYLLNANKEYVCIIYFHSPISEKQIKSIFNLFTGKLYQRPPLKSSVARKLRVREIFYNKIIDINGQYTIFRVGSEAGTYIRKLCFDIGEALCMGAHMVDLRRTQSGVFSEDKSLVTLQNLKDAIDIYREENDEFYIRNIIQPLEKITEAYPKIIVRDSAIDAICHGANLASPGVLSVDASIQKGHTVAIMSQKKELIAFGTALKSGLKIYKVNSGIVVKVDKVFMERNTYPKWSAFK